jgi:phospholipid/cholesterol/gamma-HCH transport system substrate-binding protein
MNRNVIETVLGAVVLLTAAVFLSFAYGSADLGKKAGYNVRADFDRIDGLKPGGDVRMNGVMVGSILNISLDKENFRATVNFSLDEKIKLPRDTIAMIASESLLGGKYLSLEVGVEDENIATDGTGKLTRTTPPMRLDDLIGHMIFKEDDKKKNQNQQPGTGNTSSNIQSNGPLNNMPLLATEPAPNKSATK